MRRTVVAVVVCLALAAALWYCLRETDVVVAPKAAANTPVETKRDAAVAPGSRRPAAKVAVDEPTDSPAPWEILVLGAHDAPLAGVTADAIGHPRDGRPRTTSTHGVVTLQRLAGQTSLEVALGGSVPSRRVTLTEPRTVVRIVDALPLLVRLVDAETGAPIAGGAVMLGRRDVPFSAEHGGFRLAASPACRGEKVRFEVGVKAPRGHVDCTDAFTTVVGTFAESVELTVLLWPELELSADLQVVDRRPFLFANVEVAGRTRRHGADIKTPGPVSIRGVPFIRNAHVAVDVKDAEWRGHGETTLGPLPGAPATVRIRKGEREGRSTPNDVARRSDLNPPESDLPRGDATVVVNLTRPDGGVAVDVPVGLACWPRWRLDARTDAQGRATFAHIPAGEWEAAVYAEGIAATERVVVAVDGAVATASIRPSRGLASTITVVDETDRALPCAAVSIVDGAHVQTDDGVQQLILRADAYGRCRLHGLPSGKLTAFVQWDWRSAEVEFTAGEDAKVVLPASTE